MAQLQKLGFQETDARQALSASRQNGGGDGGGGSGTSNGVGVAASRQRDLSAALDWLCMHLPEEALPAKYDAGEKLSEAMSLTGLPEVPHSDQKPNGQTLLPCR